MAHLRPLLARYFWVLLAAVVGMAALGLVFLGLLGRAPPAIATVVPLMLAGFDAGREIKRRTGAGPSLVEGVVFAALFLAITLALYLFIFAGARAGQGLLPMLLADLRSLALPLVLFSILFFVMIRVMMWFGVRSLS